MEIKNELQGGEKKGVLNNLTDEIPVWINQLIGAIVSFSGGYFVAVSLKLIGLVPFLIEVFPNAISIHPLLWFIAGLLLVLVGYNVYNVR